MNRQRALVVGAGIIGLTTAFELERRGLEVLLFDASPISEASFAAAGMLAPVSEVVWDQPSLYPLMIESGALYPALVRAVSEATGADVGYLTSETLVCAGDSADRAYLQELMSLQSQMGMEIESVSAMNARRLEPALGPGVVGAVRIPGDHQVDPRKLCGALVEHFGDRLIRENAAEVLFDGDRAVGVRTIAGTEYRADHVLIANGIHANDLLQQINLPLRPVYGDVLRMRVPGHLQPLVSRTVRAIVRGRPVYIVPRSDGTIVLGATSREDNLAGVSAEGVHHLLRDAHHILPSILECEVLEMTARARPGSPDDVPMIGTLAPGLTVSTGYFRHGILLAAIGAKLGADIITGQPIDPETAAAINPFRFEGACP